MIRSPLYDHPLWHAAARLVQLGLLTRRRRRRRAGHPVRQAHARLGPPRLADPGWSIRALAVALDGGAFRDAEPLAAAVAAALPGLTVELRRDAVPLLVELATALGEGDAARALCQRHASDLAATARGAALVARQAPLDRLLPVAADRGLDVVALSRLVDASRLGGDELDRLLAAHRRQVLRSPELHLLGWNAHRGRDPRAALAALVRFHRAHGLPRPTRPAATGRLLDDLAFASGPARPGPLVSILVAAHDAEATIGYALASLLGQSHRELEILVCDDASRDGTRAAIDRLADDPRVRRFASRANQGPYNVRNALLPHARGELITFHDADDLALPSRIARQVASLARPGAIACMTTWLRVTRDERVVFFRDQVATRLALVSLMARRGVFEALGGFRPARFGADLDMVEAIRGQVGDAAIEVVRQPQMLGLWAATSLTRIAGAESLEDGYRSPARRAYSQLVFDRLLGRLDDDELTAALGPLGLLVEPTGVVALS